MLHRELNLSTSCLQVGIVGRTGAGKSSLLQALFRFVNVQSGTITIDGRNITDIGLDVLRGRLALVPQDSVLFQGTLRENLWAQFMVVQRVLP